MGCGASKPGQHGIFGPTGDRNSRTQHMLREAGLLAASAKLFEKHLKSAKDGLEASIEAGNVLLASPLPGVYDDKASVASSAVVGTNELVGGAGFKIDQAAKAKGDLTTRINAETHAPMSNWVARYEDAAKRQKDVDMAYDAVEAARKKVTAQKNKIDVLRTKQATDPKAAAKITAGETLLQDLGGKLSLLEKKYEDEEAAQHGRLSALNREAVVLRSAVRAALDNVGNSLLAVRDNIAADATPGAGSGRR